MKFEYKKLLAPGIIIMTILIITLVFSDIIFALIKESKEQSNVTKAMEKLFSETEMDDVNSLFEKQKSIEDIISQGRMDEYVPEYSSNIFDDLKTISKVYDYCYYISYSFLNDRYQMIDDMIYANTIENNKEYPNKYIVAANDKAIELYNRNFKLQPVFVGTHFENMYRIFNFNLSDILFILLVVLLTVRSFTYEYTAMAISQINTSKKYFKNIYYKKIITVYSIAFAILSAQAILELVIGINVYGLGGFNLHIQQIELFSGCPYNISIADFFVIKFILKNIVAIMTIMLAAMFSMMIKSPLGVNIISIIVTTVGIIINIYLANMRIDASTNKEAVDKICSFIRIIIPQSLLNPSAYFEKFDYFSLYGVPVSRLMANIGITMSVTVISYIVGFRISRKVTYGD